MTQGNRMQSQGPSPGKLVMIVAWGSLRTEDVLPKVKRTFIGP